MHSSFRGYQRKIPCRDVNCMQTVKQSRRSVNDHRFSSFEKTEATEGVDNTCDRFKRRGGMKTGEERWSESGWRAKENRRE